MKIVDVIIEGHLVGRGAVGKFIGWFTSGDYKHISGYFVFNDGHKEGFQSNSKQGCHFFDVDEARGKLHKFAVPGTPDTYLRMYQRAIEIDGSGYDHMGIWGFVRRAKRENPDKFFCSEAWADIVEKGDVILQRLPFYKISPVLFIASPVLPQLKEG